MYNFKVIFSYGGCIMSDGEIKNRHRYLGKKLKMLYAYLSQL